MAFDSPNPPTSAYGRQPGGCGSLSRRALLHQSAFGLGGLALSYLLHADGVAAKPIGVTGPMRDMPPVITTTARSKRAR